MTRVLNINSQIPSSMFLPLVALSYSNWSVHLTSRIPTNCKTKSRTAVVFVPLLAKQRDDGSDEPTESRAYRVIQEIDN